MQPPRRSTASRGLPIALVACISSAAGAAPDAAPPDASSRWWQPGAQHEFPAAVEYPDESGTLRVIYEGPAFQAQEHAFFAAIGRNGRACVSCHQPADAMSLSARTARERWDATGGTDPLFAAVDGSNCPTLPQAARSSHSLLLEQGLFRIQRPWPPRDAAGKPIRTDFSIEVVRDPWGCNSGPSFGPGARNPNISVYRRPRPVANLKYLVATGFAWDPKQGMPLPRDPATGKLLSGNLMADARAVTLEAQARDAAASHLELMGPLPAPAERQIIDFESRLYAAQAADRTGGPLDAAGALGGPRLLADSIPGQLGSQQREVWSEFRAWEDSDEDATSTPAERAFRASVARGARLFREKTFLISDTAGVNWPIGFGNPVRNSCVFCHNMSQMGNDVAPGQVDLGTTTEPFADPQPELPLFRIRCNGEPHPFYGREILTHDPGYALTTGRCADVGKITLQSLRGLAARAPYFSNGSAKSLEDVIDYYDRRYGIGYSAQEKRDLVNLLGSL